jgi:hypothetical protein
MMQIVHGDTYWSPPPVKFSGRLKRDPDHSEIAVRQVVESQEMAPSERLPKEKKVLDELLVQIGKPLGPTIEEVERMRKFPNRNYSETVAKYEDLLCHLKQRMRYNFYIKLLGHLTNSFSATTAPVDQTPHSTIKQAKNTQQQTRNLDVSVQALVESLSDNSHVSRAYVPSSSRLEKPVFYRRFASRRRNSPERDVHDIRGSGRLDRLYCHDSSPYVYRETFHLIDDEVEVKKWILGNQIVLQEELLKGMKKRLEATKARLEKLNSTSDT